MLLCTTCMLLCTIHATCYMSILHLPNHGCVPGIVVCVPGGKWSVRASGQGWSVCGHALTMRARLLCGTWSWSCGPRSCAYMRLHDHVRAETTGRGAETGLGECVLCAKCFRDQVSVNRVPVDDAPYLPKIRWKIRMLCDPK